MELRCLHMRMFQRLHELNREALQCNEAAYLEYFGLHTITLFFEIMLAKCVSISLHHHS